MDTEETAVKQREEATMQLNNAYGHQKESYFQDTMAQDILVPKGRIRRIEKKITAKPKTTSEVLHLCLVPRTHGSGMISKRP